MRYLWPLLFVGFIFLSIDFATQNTAEVTLLYTIDWLNLTFRSTRPLFVPLFFTLAWGILFCVVYFSCTTRCCSVTCGYKTRKLADSSGSCCWNATR